MEDEGEPLSPHKLFGGAVHLSFPDRFGDVSDVRPVPDNQEVRRQYQEKKRYKGCVPRDHDICAVSEGLFAVSIQLYRSCDCMQSMRR